MSILMELFGRKQDKTYCNNCKHYWPGSDMDCIEGICRKVHEFIRDLNGKISPEYPNKKNKCEFYERKWWKFWK